MKVHSCLIISEVHSCLINPLARIFQSPLNPHPHNVCTHIVHMYVLASKLNSFTNFTQQWQLPTNQEEWNVLWDEAMYAVIVAAGTSMSNMTAWHWLYVSRLCTPALWSWAVGWCHSAKVGIGTWWFHPPTPSSTDAGIVKRSAECIVPL